jgi:hypothetical protein
MRRKGGKAKRVGAAVFIVYMAVILLYIGRLEAHTNADFFLPTDYHSEMRGLASTADDSVMETYYFYYSEQAKRPYTVRQDLMLSQFAYIDAPEGLCEEPGRVTLGQLCDALIHQADETTQESMSLFIAIRDDLTLSRLAVEQFIDTPSGLMGYVFSYGGEITIAFRGTDGFADVLDNMAMLPFNLSMQYPSVRALLSQFDTTSIWLTGHSKGGHNAIYAASIDPRCHATAFNAPGFGVFLTDEQHDGLNRGVNYVINGDATGFLLFHLERRVILETPDTESMRSLSFNNKHRLASFSEIDSLAIARAINPMGVACEWLTQLIWLTLVFIAGYSLIIKSLKQYVL